MRKTKDWEKDRESTLSRVVWAGLYKEGTVRFRVESSYPQKKWDWQWRASSGQRRKKGPDVRTQVLGLKKKKLNSTRKQKKTIRTTTNEAVCYLLINKPNYTIAVRVENLLLLLFIFSKYTNTRMRTCLISSKSGTDWSLRYCVISTLEGGQFPTHSPNQPGWWN